MSKNCPSCGSGIGIWPIFVAFRPDRIKCPQCGSTLQFRNTGSLRSAMVAIAALAGIAAFIAADNLTPIVRFAMPAVAAVLSWFVLELLAAWYLWSRYQLEISTSARG